MVNKNLSFFDKLFVTLLFISSFWSFIISFPLIIESIGIIFITTVASFFGESTFLNFTPEYVSNYSIVFLASLILFFNGWFGIFAGVQFFRKILNYKRKILIYSIINILGFSLMSFSLSLIGFPYLSQIRFVNYVFLFLNLLTIFYMILKKT